MNQIIKPNTKSEKGITLVALLITVVILVVLTAVAVKGITGNNGLIKTTEVVAEDYRITSYKEQIRQKVSSIVVGYAAMGKEANEEQIAEELGQETMWVKNAKASLIPAKTNEDVLVTTYEGYVFQVYYNSTYGAIYVEYIGMEERRRISKPKSKIRKKHSKHNHDNQHRPRRNRKSRTNI